MKKLRIGTIILFLLPVLYLFVKDSEYKELADFILNFFCMYFLLYCISIMIKIQDLEKEKIHVILKKIDTETFKSFYISFLFDKNKEDILNSLNVIANINKKNPEWFIKKLSLGSNRELKEYFLSKKEFIDYLKNFKLEIIHKYFKEDIENLKYLSENNDNYNYFKELVKYKNG